MTTQLIEQSKTEAFAERLFDILNSGALTLAISIGHRTRLFDTMAELPPATSEEIAQAAGLNERYVREWLGAVVTGRIIDYDPLNRTYHLPPEHAALLTRAATPDNVAVTMQLVPLIANVEDKIIECFNHGGGVPYSAYTRFHEVMAEDSGQTVVAVLTDAILPLVPGLIEALNAGIQVLDTGCGSGRAINKMAQAFPQSQFSGYDFSEEAIARAQQEAQNLGLTNINFQVRDAAIEFEHEYDLITAFDAIHDQAQPAKVLSNIAKALRSTGTFLMQDIRASSHLHQNLDHLAGPFLYSVSLMHCMSVSLAADGAGLGTVWGEEKALEMLKDAGFRQVEVKQLPHDPLNNFYIATK
ncbi:class I SAM-dependent methyltransferase [Anabaena catenula]|uniref:Methyltransferase domain-containing protein n=1 Tax=Anabaena catenula FACHB-362 TaxID=2692877 RepID=A0ABR8J7T1_9NOST|nr:class I SAM-dependent methyltransferase [Anabaena catenula]MBD2693645.1 methyltransferase domain-containing protein [Anabaena catenula FACHB-362]